MSFDALGLDCPIVRAVVAEGYSVPTPIQSRVIPHVIAGRDVLGCAQTGTGKTAAFALPILHRLDRARRAATARAPRVLVLSPTRELAAQIGASFVSYGRNVRFRHTVVYGGVGQHPQVRALAQGVDVVIATPGRLLDLMQQGHVRLDHLEVFVLDEADRMLDMGFLPDLKRIVARLPRRRQSLFFSATMPHKIAELAGSLLSNPVRVSVTPPATTVDLIEQRVVYVDRASKRSLLHRTLSSLAYERVLVFTRTKRGADNVARHLSRDGVTADAIHGNKSQSSRERTLLRFRNGALRVLVATDLAARGIDVDGISHVINYDLPQEPECYVHRIGRTGRAGARGVALSFCDSSERVALRAIEKLVRRAIRVDADQTHGPKTPQTTARVAPTPKGPPRTKPMAPKRHKPRLAAVRSDRRGHNHRSLARHRLSPWGRHFHGQFRGGPPQGAAATAGPYKSRKALSSCTMNRLSALKGRVADKTRLQYETEAPPMTTAECAILAFFRRYQMGPAQMLFFNSNDRNLSGGSFRTAMESLMRQGLVVKERPEQAYALTQDGYEVLAALQPEA